MFQAMVRFDGLDSKPQNYALLSTNAIIKVVCSYIMSRQLLNS